MSKIFNVATLNIQHENNCEKILNMLIKYDDDDGSSGGGGGGWANVDKYIHYSLWYDGQHVIHYAHICILCTHNHYLLFNTYDKCIIALCA